MSLTYQFRPISSWPGKPTPNDARRRATFSAGWTATLRLLEAELGHLDGSSVVIEADCDQSAIKLDGMFRAGAKLRGPGVVISFGSRVGALRYPCDTFTDWQDNVRAIALSLEALRKVERYGVTKRNEQYQGWAALPAPGQTSVGLVAPVATNALADPVRAAVWLSNTVYGPKVPGPGVFTADHILKDETAYDAAYRDAVRELHPDANGGNLRPEWHKLQDAVRSLSFYWEKRQQGGGK